MNDGKCDPAGRLWAGTKDANRIAPARLALSPQGIYLMNADGTDIRQITNDGSPAWSPDGQSIVFAAGAGEAHDIYSVSIDGSHLDRLTHTSAVKALPDVVPGWVADRLHRVPAEQKTRVMDADGGRAHPVTDIPNDAWADSLDWSPRRGDDCRGHPPARLDPTPSHALSGSGGEGNTVRTRTPQVTSCR
jgi:hypothetical protein